MDRDTVRQLALLARIALTEEEQQHATEQLGRVLEAFRGLATVDTSGVEPDPYPVQLVLRLAPDRIEPPLPSDVALANAPQARAGCFQVPRVVDG